MTRSDVAQNAKIDVALTKQLSNAAVKVKSGNCRDSPR